MRKWGPTNPCRVELGEPVDREKHGKWILVDADGDRFEQRMGDSSTHTQEEAIKSWEHLYNRPIEVENEKASLSWPSSG